MITMHVSARSRRLAPVLALAALALFDPGVARLDAQAAPATPLKLVAADGQRVVPTIQSGDTELIAFDDLTALFGVVIREDLVARAFTVAYKGKNVVLSQNQALASIGGRLVSLPAAPVKIANKWYVPVEFIGRALSQVYDVPLELRKASRLVIRGSLRVPRVIVHHEAAGAQARVTLDVVPVTPHQVIQEPSRILIKFDADLLDLSLPVVQSVGFVTAIHPGEPPTTLVVDLGPRFGSVKSSDTPLDPDGTRVTLDLFPAPETPQTTGPTTPTGPAPPAGTEPLFPSNAVKTIVVDAGHGGEELGAHGQKGTEEKALTLAVARQLKTSLETKLGARVLLTREDDRTIGLDERAALANNNKADLFVSLHANASLRHTASGAEVFYLSLDRADEEARKVAESEGVAMPVFGGGTREIDVILWEMAQARHIEQSAGLARTIDAEIRRVAPMSPRAIQQAPFRVLVGANMPAVLVEMGYLTNGEQESLLASGAFQARLVGALTESIRRFFAGDVPPAPATMTAGAGPSAPAAAGAPPQ